MRSHGFDVVDKAQKHSFAVEQFFAHAKAKRLELKAMRERVMALKCRGFTHARIAKTLGISASEVGRHARSALDELIEDTRDDTERVRALECARLDRYLVALDKQIARGDVRAVEAALKIQVRRANLYGLDVKRASVDNWADALTGLLLENQSPAAPALQHEAPLALEGETDARLH